LALTPNVMKKIIKSSLLLILGNLMAVTPAWPVNFALNTPPAQKVNLAKGAANPTELARLVVQAIQKNQFADLDAFLPDDEALTLLKNKGSEDMKALLQNSTAADIKTRFKTNYDKVIQQAIGRTLNWSELELAETKVGKGSAKNPMVQPITLTLTHKVKPPVQLLLETAKVNNRYYLFPRMELQP
jgi:hypothetical protein